MIIKTHQKLEGILVEAARSLGVGIENPRSSKLAVTENTEVNTCILPLSLYPMRCPVYVQQIISEETKRDGEKAKNVHFTTTHQHYESKTTELNTIVARMNNAGIETSRVGHNINFVTESEEGIVRDAFRKYLTAYLEVDEAHREYSIRLEKLQTTGFQSINP